MLKRQKLNQVNEDSPIHLYHSAAILESMGNKGFVFALFLPVQPHTEREARRAKSFVCTLSDMGVLHSKVNWLQESNP